MELLKYKLKQKIKKGEILRKIRKGDQAILFLISFVIASCILAKGVTETLWILLSNTAACVVVTFIDLFLADMEQKNNTEILRLQKWIEVRSVLYGSATLNHE